MSTRAKDLFHLNENVHAPCASDLSELSGSLDHNEEVRAELIREKELPVHSVAEFVTLPSKNLPTVEHPEKAIEDTAGVQKERDALLVVVADLQTKVCGLREQHRTETNKLQSARDDAFARNKSVEAAYLQKREQYAADLAFINSVRIDAERASQELLAELHLVQSHRDKLQLAFSEVSASLTTSNQVLIKAHANVDVLSTKLSEIKADYESLRFEKMSLDAECSAATARGDALRAQLVNVEAILSHKSQQPTTIWSKFLPRSLQQHLTIRKMLRSSLFDNEWYLATYSDVAKSGLTAPRHYLEQGFHQGYRPNAFFDTQWYLDRYGDVRCSGINPLIHYALHGWLEGRDPSQEFQTDFYLETNFDVRKSGINPLAHYLKYGHNEGRLPKRPPARNTLIKTF